MKRSIVYTAIASAVFLAGFQKLALAQGVLSARTNAGPALTTFNDNETFLAWAVESLPPYQVGYTTFKPPGVWAPQQLVPSTFTTVAPALAAAGENVYLALTGTDDNIYYSVWTGTEFPAAKPIPLVAQTTASPALAGYGSTLYAAWTTKTGPTTTGISYATYIGGTWTTQMPVSGASPSATIGPALAVYEGTLYLAWVTTSDTVEYATLSQSGGSWTSPLPVEGAVTSVAPALGVNLAPGAPNPSLAWTEGPPYTIKVTAWSGSGWGPTTTLDLAYPPEGYSPAMNSWEIGACLPGHGCTTVYEFYFAYTMGGPDAGEIFYGL
jgi:hypothetical protein